MFPLPLFSFEQAPRSADNKITSVCHLFMPPPDNHFVHFNAHLLYSRFFLDGTSNIGKI
jgi:hypothetical protein